MKMVTVDRSALLLKLEENRHKHHELYVEAQAGYRQLVTDTLQRAVDDARSGGDLRTFFNIQPPQDHTGDYDLVIEMLKFSVDSKITLDARDFRSYVLDKWDWSEAAMILNTGYASMGKRK